MYLNPCNMGSIPDTAHAVLDEMAFMDSNMESKSYSMTGMLESLRQAEYIDIHEVFNSRKNGLDHELIAARNGFKNLREGSELTPHNLTLWYNRYVELNAKYNAMYNLLDDVSKNPSKYKEEYKTTNAWERLLDMVLVQAADKATEAAGRAGSNILVASIPIIAFGLFAYWVYKKI